jgi:hypothetical protein
VIQVCFVPMPAIWVDRVEPRFWGGQLPSWAPARAGDVCGSVFGEEPRGTLLLVYLPVSAWKGVPQPLILND